jgi:hypothetical protein
VRSPFFRLLALGDVTNEGGDQGLPACLQVAETDVNWKLRTTLRRPYSSSPVPMGRTPGCLRYAARSLVCRRRARRGSNTSTFCPNNSSRVAEQPLGLSVDQERSAILPGYHNGIRRAFED